MFADTCCTAAQDQGVSLLVLTPVLTMALTDNSAHFVSLIVTVIFNIRRPTPLPSRFPYCVLLALSWNTNENPSTDKLSRAINYPLPYLPMTSVSNLLFVIAVASLVNKSVEEK